MDRLEADRMFVSVIEAGSFARGAERLGVSPGQASKLIGKLEQDLGVRLLHRTTRALHPTDAGRAYYDGLRDLLVEFDALDAAVRNASQTAAGRVRASVPLSFGVSALTPVLLRFARAYPEILLDVSYTDRQVNLVEEGYDVAVRIGRIGDSPSLIGRRLSETRLLRCAAPHYLADHPRPEVPDDLRDHRCILDTNMADPFRWKFCDPRTGEGLECPVTGRLRFANAEACLRAAEAGEGVASVPAFLAMESVRGGRVTPLLETWEPEALPIFALYPQGRHLARKVRVLLDFLVAEFRVPAWQ